MEVGKDGGRVGECGGGGGKVGWEEWGGVGRWRGGPRGVGGVGRYGGWMGGGGEWL